MKMKPTGKLQYVRSEGPERRYRCVFCGGGDSLSVNTDKDVWNCWKCANGGSLPALRRALSLSPAEGKRLGLIGIANPEALMKYVTPAIKVKAEFMHQECVPLPNKSKRGATAATYYLRKVRGLSTQDIVLSRIQYCWTGKYKGRVIFPLFHHQVDPNTVPDLTNMVYFVSRVIPDDVLTKFGISSVSLYRSSDPLRYRFPSKDDWGSKSLWLYGAHRAKEFEDIVICEGVLDALKVGANAVAILGKFAEHQRPVMKYLETHGVRKVTVLLDRDATDEGDDLARSVSRYFQGPVFSAELKDAKDPGVATMTQIRSALRSAASATGLVGRLNLIKRKRLRKRTF